MPRPPSINYDEILEVLKAADIFDHQNELKPRHNTVWIDVAQKFGIKADTLHSYVRLNRSDLMDKLKEHHGIEATEKEALGSSVNTTLDSSGGVDFDGYKQRDLNSC